MGQVLKNSILLLFLYIYILYIVIKNKSKSEAQGLTFRVSRGLVRSNAQFRQDDPPIVTGFKTSPIARPPSFLGTIGAWYFGDYRGEMCREF